MDRTRRSYQSVRVTVLGASGFIGRWVARALDQAGARLTLVVRDPALAEQVFAQYAVHGTLWVADLSDADDVRRLLHDTSPTIIFNLAGYGVDRAERRARDAYQLNATLVQTVCNTIAGQHDPTWPGHALVHVGSALEYGTAGGDLREDTLPSPTTLYGKSKLRGTESLRQCCRATGIRGVTVRLFTVYGPGEHAGRLLPSLRQAAMDGKPLDLTEGTQERDFTYVADVAEGLLRLGLVQGEPGEVVNLAQGRLTTVRSFAETAACRLGLPASRLRFGRVPLRVEEMRHAPVAVDRLRRLIGWVPPTDVASGIDKTLNFMASQEYQGVEVAHEY